AAGRHAEALRAFGRGHELGKKTGGWRYPSGEWIEGATLAAKKAAAQAAELDRELQAGKLPDAALDAAAAARRLLADDRPEEALRRFEAAVAKGPELASRVKARDRFHAACAAAPVARGADPQTAAGLRAKALRWLDAELEAVGEARGA